MCQAKKHDILIKKNRKYLINLLKLKRPIIALVISIVLIFINLEANARVTWIINIKTPPPGKLNTGDFWNITFTNN